MKRSSNNNNFDKRYSEYIKSKVQDKFELDISKGTLIAISPFVASAFLPNTLLQAQTCVTGLNIAYTLATSSGIYFDIDGDGNNDVRLYYSTSSSYTSSSTTYRKGLLIGRISPAGNIIAVNSEDTAINYSEGQTINGSGRIEGFAFVYYSNTANNEIKGYFNPNNGTQRGFIGLKHNGSAGFIEIEVTGLNSFILHGYGMEQGVAGGDGGTDGLGTLQAGVCSTLPVEFLSFIAQASNSSIQLNWSTASEINSVGFEIQRSLDGKNFQKIGFVDGEGNSSEIKEYSFIDKNARANNQYYYRLKQIDLNGAFEYSEIQTAKIFGIDQVHISKVYPSPSAGLSYIDVNVKNESYSTIEVFDSFGKLVLEQVHNLTVGDNQVEISSDNLPVGVYFVKLKVGEEVLYSKFVKE